MQRDGNEIINFIKKGAAAKCGIGEEVELVVVTDEDDVKSVVSDREKDLAAAVSASSVSVTKEQPDRKSTKERIFVRM